MFKTMSALLFLSAFLSLSAGDLQIKNKSRVAFLGDSITQQGQRREAGYVNLVVQMLKHKGIAVTPVKAGVSGHKSNQMLERLQRDVINKKADFLFLRCGVNDVWHGKRGVPLEQYKKNITAIVEKLRKPVSKSAS
jgi:lysophospholipase L1-like esterase